MTQQEKIRKLAVEVMGWTIHDDWIEGEGNACYRAGYLYWYNADAPRWIIWNPYTRWDHAGMVVEKLKKEWKILLCSQPDASHSDWLCTLTSRDESNESYRHVFADDDSPTAAICEAALAILKGD